MDKAKKYRYERTISFLKKHRPEASNILDLGTQNNLSKLMISSGYNVENTQGQNLDIDFSVVKNSHIDTVTAFEIFEHMFAPFNVLRNINAKHLIASVPLKLWFANAYWNEKDDWDKHYHEFEIKQFNFLLKQTGWKIHAHEKWSSYQNFTLGIRPILRMFTHRYYIVYCRKIS